MYKKTFSASPKSAKKKFFTKSQKIHAQEQPELKNQRDKASSSYKRKTQDQTRDQIKRWRETRNWTH
jgi:hypothetical protein